MIDNLNLRIQGSNNIITIGSNCTIGKDCAVWIIGNNCSVTIGDDTRIGPCCAIEVQEDNQYITIAVPLALIIAIAVYILLGKTKLGYELKATGSNKNAAKYAGMAENRNIILTLIISGALAGLGASMLYLTGYMRWECTQSSVPGMGFNGIAAAFLGGLNPIGAIFSSFFIQHITDGGQYVNTNFYSSQISDLISSVIIYLCGFVLFIKLTMNKMIARSEEKKARAIKSAASQGGDK